MSEDLKPCPFCGGEAEFVDGADDDGCWVAVACPDCGAGSRQHYPVMDDARPYAQSAWNARALSRPQTVDREAIAREGAEEIVGAMLAAITYSTQPENVAKLAPTYIEDRARLAMTRILALLYPIDDITYAGAERVGPLIEDMGSGGADWAEADVEYEVWQKDAFGDGDAMVAGSTSLADARHYAAVYGQDGPAWVVEVTRRPLQSSPDYKGGER